MSNFGLVDPAKLKKSMEPSGLSEHNTSASYKAFEFARSCRVLNLDILGP